MHRIETGDPEKLEFCSSSGVPGIAFGLFLCFGGWMALKTQMISDAPGASNVIAYGLFAMGFAAATMRFGAVMDRRSGIMTTWFGFAFPWFRRQRPMEAESVHLGREVTRRKGVTYISYPVEVILKTKKVSLGAAADNIKAWAMSQEIADFLGVPLRDESTPA